MKRYLISLSALCLLFGAMHAGSPQQTQQQFYQRTAVNGALITVPFVLFKHPAFGLKLMFKNIKLIPQTLGLSILNLIAPSIKYGLIGYGIHGLYQDRQELALESQKVRKKLNNAYSALTKQ